MPLIERAADGDQMHDRKNLLALEKLALKRVMVRQQPHNIGMGAERRRLARAQIGIDLAGGEQFAKRSAAAILLNRHGAKERQRVWMGGGTRRPAPTPYPPGSGG